MTAEKQDYRQDGIPKLPNQDINKTIQGTWNGSASDWSKTQGIEEKVGLYCCYYPLCKSSAMIYDRQSHQIIQRQKAEAMATQTRTSSPMSVDTQPQDDEMMDIQPQDDEVTGPGDCQMPVVR